MGSQFALARYDAYGNLDPSFHYDGKVLTGFDGEGEAGGTALAIDSRGRIVVVGVAGGLLERRFALARYNEDGSLDTSFHYDGKVLTDFRSTAGESIAALTMYRGARIVVVSSAWSPD